ncbi:MAG: UvrD-helicase domain-containing protein [Clostridia bacterium]|nr:UvrD-helicase domain-containing protein [Clostridia bacterium]
MITERELKKEKNYLKAVLYVLDKEIAKANVKIDEYSEDVKSQLKYTWDAETQTDENCWAENVRLLELKSISAINTTNKVKSYLRMIKSAYFARIDFETEGDTLPIYLGIATLEDGRDFYVYDWRTPIASMFYDFEMGEAQYETPDGEIIKGKITLKRQYKIDGENIVQIFDTNMQIIDDILKEMLQGKASDKMKNIVTTIQKEQNKIIRKNDTDILVVQGPAGSGKTSVAMHKIAYLLYSEKNKISNSNILILSPNDIFSDYVSNVLPEIGEDNVYQTTFMDFIKSRLDMKIKGSLNDLYETYYTENVLTTKRSTDYNSIMLKYGATYINLIENFIALKKNQLLGIEDIVVDNKVIIDKAYLEKMASEFEASGISIVEQGKKLIEKILLHISIKLGAKKDAVLQKVRKNFENNINKINAKSLYLDLYSDEKRFVQMVEDIYNSTGTSAKNRLTIKQLSDIFNSTANMLGKNTIQFEDITGYLYMKDRLQGSKVQNTIKYVIIDEAQDYTIMQYRILSHLFKNAKITALGDLNQSIMPFSTHNNYDGIINVLKGSRTTSTCDTKYLTKTYRSTYEINLFAKHLLGDTNMYNQVDRHGDEVSIIPDNNKKSKVFDDAIELKKYYNTIAIITKTQKQADELKEQIDKSSKRLAFKLITGKDKLFSADKIMIIPSYLAKGLEFDAVLAYNVSEENYPAVNKNLLYVVCTRALHKLNIYHTGELTKLIV